MVPKISRRTRPRIEPNSLTVVEQSNRVRRRLVPHMQAPTILDAGKPSGARTRQIPLKLRPKMSLTVRTNRTATIGRTSGRLTRYMCRSPPVLLIPVVLRRSGLMVASVVRQTTTENLVPR